MKPIIFSTQMVKAILEPRKTQTRRTYGLDKVNKNPNEWAAPVVFEDGYARFFTPNGEGDETIHCPYNGVGDKLWVRETWAVDGHQWDNTKPSEINPLAEVWYPAGADLMNIPQWVGKLRPSIFMPRWASRITLEITEIRVERLHEISYEDARAEGILSFNSEHRDTNGGMGYNRGLPNLPMRYESTAAFMDLWDFINGLTHPWSSNPWCWCISFKESR